MPIPETGAASPNTVASYPDSPGEPQTEDRVGTMTVDGNTLQIEMEKAGRHPKVAEICKRLHTVYQNTDRYARMEMDCSLFPLVDGLRHWFRDGVRERALLREVDRFAEHAEHLDGGAWFSVFVLAEAMDTQRRGATMRTSVDRARQHGTPWMLTVLAHWVCAGSDTGPVGTLRRKTVQVLTPLWNDEHYRDGLAPILGSAIAMRDDKDKDRDRDFPKQLIEDWEAVFKLLPWVPQDKAKMSEAECLLAVGLFKTALRLDQYQRPSRPSNTYVRRIVNRLGDEADKIDEGSSLLRKWEIDLMAPQWDSEESESHDLRMHDFYDADWEYRKNYKFPSDFEVTN